MPQDEARDGCAAMAVASLVCAYALMELKDARTTSAQPTNFTECITFIFFFLLLSLFTTIQNRNAALHQPVTSGSNLNVTVLRIRRSGW